MLNKFVNLNFSESKLRRKNFHPKFCSHFFNKESPRVFQPRPVHVIRYAFARIITNLHTKCATLIVLGGSGGQPRTGNTQRWRLRCARTRIDRLYDAIASYVYLCGARARAHASSRRDSTYSNLFTVLEDDSVTGNDLDLLHHLLLYTIVRLCTATRSYFRISSGRLTFLRACWLLIKYFFRPLDGKHEKTFVTQFVLVISGCLKFKGEQVECAREQHFARTSIGTLDSVWCDTVSRRFSRYNGKSQASFTNVFHFVIPFRNGWLLECSWDANV